MTLRLRKTLPKRSEFDDKVDYLHARQVYVLCRELHRRGATAEELRALLEKEDGGFTNWRFLFEETPEDLPPPSAISSTG